METKIILEGCPRRPCGWCCVDSGKQQRLTDARRNDYLTDRRFYDQAGRIVRSGAVPEAILNIILQDLVVSLEYRVVGYSNIHSHHCFAPHATINWLRLQKARLRPRKPISCANSASSTPASRVKTL